MSIESASAVLSKFKVLDLTRARAGPTAVKQLADWGASVIKIEMPDTGVRVPADVVLVVDTSGSMGIPVEYTGGSPGTLRTDVKHWPSNCRQFLLIKNIHYPGRAFRAPRP